ncbi:MAG: hypothetical protein K1Y36_00595 [Blastocatellia bacterium]|nr:hypothetical protein [Blastocatellia bacterium]
MTSSVNHSFRIRSQGVPERCEVCHQKDRFDPQTGRCDRCNYQDDSRLLLNPRQVAVPEQFRQVLTEELAEDEWLLWVGTPNPHRISRRTWKYMGINAILTMVLVLSWGFAEVRHETLLPLFIFLLFFVAHWVGSSLRDWEKARHTVYAVTNQRLVVIEDVWKTRTTCQTLETLHSIRHVLNEDGSGDLIFQNPETKRHSKRFGFFGIDDHEQVKRLVCEHLLPGSELPQ